MKSLSPLQRLRYFYWTLGCAAQIVWLAVTARDYAVHLQFFSYNWTCARTGLRTDQPDTDFDWGKP